MLKKVHKPFAPTVLLSMCPRFLGLDVHVSATQTCVNIISALWSRSCRGRNSDTNDLLTHAAGFCEFVLSFDETD